MRHAMCLGGVVLALIASNRTHGQARFSGLGDIPGEPHISVAIGVSADGTSAVGWGLAMPYARQAVYWTDSVHAMGYLPAPYDAYSFALAASADGSVIVGRSDYEDDEGSYLAPLPFRWTAATGMQALPAGSDFPGAGVGQANDCSADGNVIVGFAFQTDGVRWVGGAIANNLGPYNVPSAVSSDGSVAAGTQRGTGFSDPRAFHWSEAGGLVVLAAPYLISASRGHDISADGSIIVGSVRPVGQQDRAFRWTAVTGMVELPDLPGGAVRSVASAISGDGAVILGNSESAAGYVPVLWTAAGGVQTFRDYLESRYGLAGALQGWALWPEDISADGRVIVGGGTNPNGQSEAWAVRLPYPPCAADWNRDGQFNSADIAAYLGAWFADLGAGTTGADMNMSGTVNSSDLTTFLSLWFGALAGGC